MVQTATATPAAPENPTAIFDTAIADAERLLELFDKDSNEPLCFHLRNKRYKSRLIHEYLANCR